MEPKTQIQFSAKELSFVRQFFNDDTINLLAFGKWGSGEPKYREQIHQALGEIQNCCDSSISHTHGLGGFAYSLKPGQQFGLDIEKVSRITLEIARRICSDRKEVNWAPSPAHLWVAKEAAFKSLKGPNQPFVISKLDISGWRKENSQFDSCVVKNREDFGFSAIKGLTISKTEYIFSIFQALP